MSTKGETVLLVWDSDEKLSHQNDVAYWCSYHVSESKSVFSIPNLV